MSWKPPEDAERARRLSGYDPLVRRVSELLFAADPADLAYIGHPHVQDNPDEYDSEAETIVLRLIEGVGREDVARVVHEEFTRCLGESSATGARARFLPVANDIWDAWQDFRAGFADSHA